MFFKNIVVIGLLFNGYVCAMEDKPLTDKEKIEEGKKIALKDALEAYALLCALNESAETMLKKSSKIEDKQKDEMLKILNENKELNIQFDQLCRKEPFNVYRLFSLYVKNAEVDFGVFQLLYKDKSLGCECFENYRELFIKLEKKYDSTLSLQSNVNSCIFPAGFKSNLKENTKKHTSL